MTILTVIDLPEFLLRIHHPWHLIAFLGVSVYQRSDSVMKLIAKICLVFPFSEVLAVRWDPPGLHGLHRTCLAAHHDLAFCQS